MRKKALLPEERKIQIINWFAIRIQHENEQPASLYEIAKGVGLTPSSKLRKLVHELVEEGALECSRLNRSGRWEGRGYMLKAGTFQRPQKQTRAIKFTYKGVSQLEMF